MSDANLFDHIPADLPEELAQTLLEQPGVRIERIVSRGHASPDGFWYDQDEHEWVALLKGKAAVQFEDEEELRELKPGDFLHIPAHCRHRVAWTAPDTDTVWLAIFFG